jgi:long-chain fatty acid transport protein
MRPHPQDHGKLPHRAVVAAVLAMLGSHAVAGGLTFYEISSRDVGLASAGYTARAQDASTVMTNPAGMIRLEGTQAMAAGQLLYGDVDFSPQVATAGGRSGGNAIGWLPGAGAFVSHSLAPDLKIGFGLGGNFGAALRYDDHWVGRYYGKEATLLGLSLLPSVAFRLDEHWSVGATLNAMYGIFKNEVAVNNVLPGLPDGELKLDNRKWGWGVNLGLLYELNETTRFGLTYNSQVKLNFAPNAQFRNLGPGLNAALTNRGLLNARLDLGIRVPQGLLASVVHQVDPRWTVLGSIGWQQWSKFGKVDVGIEGNNLTVINYNFDDTWHGALGAQYHVDDARTLDFGIAYDSGFQDKSNVSPLLPANSAWRFGIGLHNQVDKGFSWAAAAEYLYGGTLNVNKRSILPVALGGRGDLVGSYNSTHSFFLSANANWTF